MQFFYSLSVLFSDARVGQINATHFYAIDFTKGRWVCSSVTVLLCSDSSRVILDTLGAFTGNVPRMWLLSRASHVVCT